MDVLPHPRPQGELYGKQMVIDFHIRRIGAFPLCVNGKGVSHIVVLLEIVGKWDSFCSILRWSFEKGKKSCLMTTV
jgi:hypothetical protein